ncbi:MAG: 1-acyl-sn-glycerol-3-phosphate acyltransferase [Anaerolineae bacterium]|nr:1-acyl-sn-glycerol-3-phosphate acyltransferase [Anaerolineae bacterium]
MLKKRYHFFHRIVSNLFARAFLNYKVFWDAPLPDEAVIFAVNHPTTTDPLLLPIITRRPLAILVTEMAFDLPWFGPVLRAAGHIPVRVKTSNGKGLIESAVEMLKIGRSVGIFPEGILSPKMGSFHHPHSGAARIALTSGAKVVPVGIHMMETGYTSTVTKSENFESTSRWAVRGPYYLSVGEAMTFTGDVENRELVNQVTHKIFEAVKHQAHASEERVMAEQPLWQPLSRLLWGNPAD